MLAKVTYGPTLRDVPEAVNFEFDQANVRIICGDFVARLFSSPAGPTLEGTDDDIRQWVGDARFEVAHPEQGGKFYRAWLSDKRTMRVYPKPALGELSVEEWITGCLHLRR